MDNAGNNEHRSPVRLRTSPLARAVAGGALVLAATLTLSAMPHQQASAATLVSSPSESPANLSFGADHTAISALDVQQAQTAKPLAKVQAAPASTRKPITVKKFTPDPVVASTPVKAATTTTTTHHRSSSSSASAGPIVNYSGQSPRAIAQGLLASYGWGQSQMPCLNSLWNRESGWNVHAANPSGAYGIPQALPGSKMSSAGPDWANNPTTQIKWGLGYIKSMYGSPCGAWGHSQSTGWY
ncbi:hypothetical protein LK09_18865 [Microbacterium mangrovi]|uniref:Transglycosylase SLT domain-containing protein n=1 Tax=Microbacterium mangrovi TaxID=1348253 RepID=A0A0B2A1U3_9MICO|nr:hypothetical protein LK09_18865 [Microbacterium mangrovi]